VGQALAHHLLQPLGARDCGVDLRGRFTRWQVKNWAGHVCVFVKLLLFVAVVIVFVIIV
jgi:hypothetical protein